LHIYLLTSNDTQLRRKLVFETNSSREDIYAHILSDENCLTKWPFSGTCHNKNELSTSTYEYSINS